MPNRNLFLLVVLLMLLFACANPSGIKKSGSSFSDTQFSTGALEEDAALKAQIGFYRSFTRGDSLPSKVDLTNMMPPVKNQGGQGSCIGWAIGYAMKTFQEGVEESWDISATNGQFSPAWIYNQINGGSDSGGYVPDALNLIVNRGCDTWENFPYDSNDYTTQPDYNSNRRAFNFKAKSWKYIPNEVTELKSIIANEGQAIIFRLHVCPDFDAISPENPVFDDPSGSSRGGHALCIVGYDDDLRAFKFQNSWGSGWGTYRDDNDVSKGKGFGWLSYDFVVDYNPIGFQSYKLVDDINYTAETLWSEKDIYENHSSVIYYYGELINSTAITLNWTCNDASGSINTGMYKLDGLWRAAITVPDGITKITFSITDNEGTIDNNDGPYWKIDVLPTFKAQFNCFTSGSSSPVSNILFNLHNTDTNEYFTTDSSNNGVPTATGLTGGSYNVSAYSNSYTFENGSSNYVSSFKMDGSDHEQNVILTFVKGSMKLSFSGYSTTNNENPLSGMPLDLYLDDIYKKSVNIYLSASDNNLQPGTWKAVLDGFKAGKSYKAETEFIIDESNPKHIETLTVSVTPDLTRKMVYYYNSMYETANIHFQKDNGSWTNSPGKAMTANYDGWYSLLIDDSDEVIFCFNNGDGMWDSRNGSNYSTTLQDIYVYNGNIYTQKITKNTLSLQVHKIFVPEGYSLQARVNQPVNGNEPWNYGYSMTLTDNSDYCTASLFFTNGTALEYKYVLVDPNGLIYWESIQGNRSAVTPDIKIDEPFFGIENKTVTFNVQGLNLTEDYNVEVRGDFDDNPWTGHTMSLQNNGNFSLSLQIEKDNFAYKYTILDPDGHIIWENFNGNRYGSSPGSYMDTAYFNL